MCAATVTFTWQSIITAGGVITALLAIFALFAKVVRFIDRQKAQDEESRTDREEREREVEELRNLHTEDMKAVKEEQALIVWGVLACLKGLKEQGCNGPVTQAIDKIEKHLNINAHK